MKGSMTVEAAVVLPLLLLFFLHLGSCMEMLRLHGRLEYALWQTGRELTAFAAAEPGEDIPDTAVSYLYVNGRVQQILNREYLDDSPLVYGSLGLNYLASEYQEDESINIVLTYQVSPPITCFPFPYFRMISRYYGRAWTGYSVGQGEERVRYVYVTEDGSVWHGRADCSYLKLHIYSASPENVWMLRNADGERYGACSRCGRNPQGEIVYLTQEGNRYHTVRSCPALQRRVHAVKWQEDIPYRPCSRCNQHNQA
ncbi:MAG: hypothetical protein NC543_12970 [bacterium]|nr:hypothetical protein [bacterium]MCM1374694.1 hypothetical protein [Muribaculum sp.]